MSRPTEPLRVPPHNREAEQGLLGSLMLVNQYIDAIDLQPAEMHDSRHETILAVLTECWNAGHRALDLVTLGSELERRNKLADAGGAEYLNDIALSVPHPEHARYYAGIVRQKAKQRRLTEIGRQLACDAYRDDADPDELLAQLDRDCLNLVESSTSGEFVTMAAAVDALEARENNPQAVHSTGLVDLDRQLHGGGIADGQLIIAGGRPGSGKSALGAQVGMTFAKRGEPAVLISLEMKHDEIADRFAKSIDRQQLRQLPLQIVDTVSHLDRIASLIRLAHRRDGVCLAIVDYLQLVESGDRRANREQQVAAVSRMLKRLTMELSIPIIAACQLNRQSEQEKRRPRLSDLRESGSIEQDANTVLLLHRGDDNAAECIVAKQRNGAPGVVHLAFRPEVYRFEDGARGTEYFQ